MMEYSNFRTKAFTFLDDDCRQVIFTPEKYDPKTGQLVGVNQNNARIAVEVGRFMLPYDRVELEWD